MTQPDLPDWLTKVALTEDVTVATQVLANNQTGATVDVSAFQSVLITSSASPLVAPSRIDIVWLDIAGAVIGSEFVSGDPLNASGVIPPAAIPIRGPKMRVINRTGASQTITIYGTIRPVGGLRGNTPQDVQVVSDGGLAKVAGTTYDLGPIIGGGLHWLYMISTALVVAGQLVCTVGDDIGLARDIVLTDTVLAHNTGGNLHWAGQVILPQSAYHLRFICTASGTNTVAAYLISLNQW